MRDMREYATRLGQTVMSPLGGIVGASGLIGGAGLYINNADNTSRAIGGTLVAFSTLFLIAYASYQANV